MNNDKLNADNELNPIIELQQLGRCGKGIKVGIIDGAIDSQHPLLAHLEIQQRPESHPTKHGTSVCSLIAGNGFGLAPQVDIFSYPLFVEDNDGVIHGCSERLLARAINNAVSAGCHIINISGASLSVNGMGTDELRSAVSHCEKNNVLIVAATGNDGRNSESIPASINGVLAVGACDVNGLPAEFNNYGHKLRKKMLIASGIDMPVASPDSCLSVVSGSSFAAPVVSGVSALLISSLMSIPLDIPLPKLITKLIFDSATHNCKKANSAKLNEFSRLNIPKLVHLVKQVISSSNPQSNRRITTMSNTPTESTVKSESTLNPSLLDEDQSGPSEIDPDTSNLGLTEIEPVEIKASEQTSLSLPVIRDPASNNHVHVKPSDITPQHASDARSVRDAEKVFLIGTICYDFGTEARLDYFTQVMGNQKGHPFDPIEMANHLKSGDNAEQSNALIWTLKIDGIPVYAVEPENQFAVLQYARLVEFLHEQEIAGVERVSIAGIVTGETRLFNGHTVPTISPVLRGMFNWKSKDLAKLVLGSDVQESVKTDQLTNFLNRVYYELRNRGVESHERAINYAATNAYQMKEIFDDAFNEQLFLNKISAKPSPVSRPDSDCWDVVLEFFNPKERLTAARKLFRYTIDVSDLMPVTIGTLRSWHAY